ncbi:hypothetical protein [uncultured Amphritea sp.]|uniref:hypothetical protein n=1 Tax=uncultured Amphritea sp. TaxID=981605 RepID=UPI0026377D91|nr:hypothetical protein [uncultured Amphritea sp.]
MSETAGTVIKLLSALTSPKASVKYLSVGIFLVLSWKYLDNTLASLDAPKEHHSLIVLLIGLGIGSLIGQAIYVVVSSIWKKIDTSIKEKKEKQRKDELEKAQQRSVDQENEEFLEGFKKAFEHFPYWKRDALRLLIDKEQRMEWSLDYVNSLKTNKYILRTINIDSDTDLYKIHPAIRDYVKAQWKAEIDSNMADFFGNLTPEKNELIEVMKFTEEEFKGPISQACADLVYPIHPCFTREAEDEIGFYISFRNPYCSLFNEKTGLELIDEVYIKHSWVRSEDVSA